MSSCMHARVGGPLPSGWYEQQWNLQKQIVQRQTELGVASLLPAFQGNVPELLKGLYPQVSQPCQATGGQAMYLPAC